MSYHVFAEDTISPDAMGVAGSVAQRIINIRDVLDQGGPHLLTFGARCVVSDPLAGTLDMRVEYETPNGQLRSIYVPGPIDLTVISFSSGAMWYAPQELVIDKRYPLGDGPGVDPYGVFRCIFACTAPAASKVAYEIIVSVFDGSPAVVNHP